MVSRSWCYAGKLSSGIASIEHSPMYLLQIELQQYVLNVVSM